MKENPIKIVFAGYTHGQVLSVDFSTVYSDKLLARKHCRTHFMFFCSTLAFWWKQWFPSRFFVVVVNLYIARHARKMQSNFTQLCVRGALIARRGHILSASRSPSCSKLVSDSIGQNKKKTLDGNQCNECSVSCSWMRRCRAQCTQVLGCNPKTELIFKAERRLDYMRYTFKCSCNLFQNRQEYS